MIALAFSLMKNEIRLTEKNDMNLLPSFLFQLISVPSVEAVVSFPLTVSKEGTEHQMKVKRMY